MVPNGEEGLIECVNGADEALSYEGGEWEEGCSFY